MLRDMINIFVSYLIYKMIKEQNKISNFYYSEKYEITFYPKYKIFKRYIYSNFYLFNNENNNKWLT